MPNAMIVMMMPLPLVGLIKTISRMGHIWRTIIRIYFNNIRDVYKRQVHIQPVKYLELSPSTLSPTVYTQLKKRVPLQEQTPATAMAIMSL